MIVEFQFVSMKRGEQCMLALCDDPVEQQDNTAYKYWETHGIKANPNGEWGKFVAKRKGDEWYLYVACNKLSNIALQWGLKSADASIGLQAAYEDYIRMSEELRDFMLKNDYWLVDGKKEVVKPYEEILCETTVYLEDDGGEPPYDGKTWPDIDVCIESLPPDTKFKPGDKIQIIARKVNVLDEVHEV